MRVAIGVSVAWIFVTAASADPAATVEQVFDSFGLFGTWASNCAADAAPANPRVTILMPTPGIVFEEHNLGADYAVNRYSVLTAQKVAADRVSVDVIFQPGTADEERQTLEFQVHNGTRRTLFNQPDGGAPRVRGGVALATGARTPLLRKCE